MQYASLAVVALRRLSAGLPITGETIPLRFSVAALSSCSVEGAISFSDTRCIDVGATVYIRRLKGRKNYDGCITAFRCP